MGDDHTARIQEWAELVGETIPEDRARESARPDQVDGQLAHEPRQ